MGKKHKSKHKKNAKVDKKNAKVDKKNAKVGNKEAIFQNKKVTFDRIVTILPVVGTVISLVQIWQRYLYRINCGKYYGIPDKYFIDDFNRGISFLLLFGIMLVMLFSPIFLKIKDYKTEVDKVLNTIYNVSISFCMAFIFGDLCSGIFIQFTNGMGRFIFWVLGMIAWMYVLCYKEIGKIKNGKIKFAIKFLSKVSVILCLFFWIVILVYNLQRDVSDKTYYEIFYENEECRVVLSTYNDCYLVAKLEQDDDKSIINTEEYTFVPIDKVCVTYIDLTKEGKEIVVHKK